MDARFSVFSHRQPIKMEWIAAATSHGSSKADASQTPPPISNGLQIPFRLLRALNFVSLLYKFHGCVIRILSEIKIVLRLFGFGACDSVPFSFYYIPVVFNELYISTEVILCNRRFIF